LGDRSPTAIVEVTYLRFRPIRLADEQARIRGSVRTSTVNRRREGPAEVNHLRLWFGGWSIPHNTRAFLQVRFRRQIDHPQKCRSWRRKPVRRPRVNRLSAPASGRSEVSLQTYCEQPAESPSRLPRVFAGEQSVCRPHDPRPWNPAPAAHGPRIHRGQATRQRRSVRVRRVVGGAMDEVARSVASDCCRDVRAADRNIPSF
jgi:hypothetical protein